jgi:membrane associated rhomboid family serine protease
MISTWGTAVGRTMRGQSAPVTYGLIFLCCLIFLIGPASGLNPSFGTGDALVVIHGSWLHLLGNMLFFYVFGAMTEERMGHVQFAVFYVVCGYLALLGYAIANSGSEQTLVGASGAISAVLGAFLYLFPRARVTSLFPFLFFLPLRFPAWVVLPFWVTLQWLAAGRSPSGPGVAYLAHLVGFSLGFVYAWVRFGRPTRVKTPAAAPEGENQP